MIKVCEAVHSAVKIESQLLNKLAERFAKKEIKKRHSIGELRFDDEALELSLRWSTHTYRHGNS